MTMIAPGEYIQIRNMMDQEINDLYYGYAEYEKLKVRKIPAHAKENFMIITTNLTNDHDLTFYFDEAEKRMFLFADAVKKMTCETTWAYQFYKIIEKDGKRVIVQDEEAETAYFADNQS